MKALYKSDKSRVDTKHCERLLLPLTPLFFNDKTSTETKRIEAYIAEQFFVNYRAEISHFFPYFLTSQNDNALSSAVGFNPAIEGETLFLENYFDAPVETIIENKINQVIERASIVEIGNLTSTRRGSSYMLFILIAAILHKAGFDWVVFTATPHVQKILNKLSLHWVRLADADPLLLEDKGESWGTYYDHKPSVVVGNLTEAMGLLSQQAVVQFMLENYSATIDRIAKNIAK